MTDSLFGSQCSVWDQAPDRLLTAAFASGATRVFPIIERLGSEITKRSCRKILDDLWDSVGKETTRIRFQKHLETLDTLPESSESDSHKPEYLVQRTISVLWVTVRGWVAGSRHEVLNDWLSEMIQIGDSLDGLIIVNIGHESHLGDTEVEYQQEVYHLLQNKPELDAQTIDTLRARSVEMSDSYRTAIEEIAQAQAWAVRPKRRKV